LTVRAVLGIARLGETDLFGWWQSRGLGVTSEYVLGGALPRTWMLSALELDVVSASIRHNEALPRQTAIHLFSYEMPAKRWALGWLRGHKTEGEVGQLVRRLRAWDRESAIVDLRGWVVGTSAISGEVLARGLRLGAVQAPDLTDPTPEK
jgi:hypothetical protein